MTPEDNIKSEELKKAAGEAVMQIGFIREQASVMGANDSEIIELNLLIDSVNNGGDTGIALARAHQILASKQDYH